MNASINFNTFDYRGSEDDDFIEIPLGQNERRESKRQLVRDALDELFRSKQIHFTEGESDLFIHEIDVALRYRGLIRVSYFSYNKILKLIEKTIRQSNMPVPQILSLSRQFKAKDLKVLFRDMALAADPSIKDTHKVFAESLLAEIKAQKFISPNYLKRTMAIPENPTDQEHNEIEKTFRKRDQVVSFYRSVINFQKNVNQLDEFTIELRYKEELENRKVGICGEIASYTFLLASQKDPTLLSGVVIVVNGDHEVAVVDPDPNCDRTDPDTFGAKARVIDGWEEISFSVVDYKQFTMTTINQLPLLPDGRTDFSKVKTAPFDPSHHSLYLDITSVMLPGVFIDDMKGLSPSSQPVIDSISTQLKLFHSASDLTDKAMVAFDLFDFIESPQCKRIRLHDTMQTLESQLRFYQESLENIAFADR